MKTTWCKIPDEAMERLKSGRLSPREWHVFAVLCSLAHYENRVATTSAAEVGELTGIPRQTVTRILRQLESLHRWITLHFPKGGNSRYSIEVHFLPQLREPAFLDEKPERMSEPEPEVSRLNGWIAPEDLPDEESSLISGARARRRERRVSRESKSKRKSLSPEERGQRLRFASLPRRGGGFARCP